MFPTDKSDLTDNVSEIIAAHINNLEDHVGVNGSTDTDSIIYKLGDINSGEKMFRVGDVKISTRAAGYGWLLLDGSSIGSAASGADNASDSYEDLFDHLVTTLGLTATDTWASNGTVDLPDMKDHFPIGKSSTKALASSDTTATVDLEHSHSITKTRKWVKESDTSGELDDVPVIYDTSLDLGDSLSSAQSIIPSYVAFNFLIKY